MSVIGALVYLHLQKKNTDTTRGVLPSIFSWLCAYKLRVEDLTYNAVCSHAPYIPGPPLMQTLMNYEQRGLGIYSCANVLRTP